MMEFISTNRIYIEQMALKYYTQHHIHEKDYIFKFIVENPSFDNVSSAIEYYFSDGLLSAEKIHDLVRNEIDSSKKINILEFASGYGCVSRHLNRIDDNWITVCCDIHDDAVNFLREKIKINAILSNSFPEKLEIEDCSFDVVFCLSFFSHMPRKTWSRWLHKLYHVVKNNGMLIFTTHGLFSRKYFQYPDLIDGFWYGDNSEQLDLDTSDYGQTITSPSFVINEIKNISIESKVKFYEGYWWGHQDLWIIRKQ